MFFLMIRAGLSCDLPAIVAMAARFWRKTEYTAPFDPEHVGLIAQQCVDNGLMVVIDDNGLQGFACAVKGPLLGSRAAYQATELAWWIDPEHRKGPRAVLLLKALEDVARAQGCQYLNMVTLNSSPPAATLLYDRMGYHKTETIYTKELL